jgi:DNA-binding FrmR family transcriptional regulator
MRCQALRFLRAQTGVAAPTRCTGYSPSRSDSHRAARRPCDPSVTDGGREGCPLAYGYSRPLHYPARPIRASTDRTQRSAPAYDGPVEAEAETTAADPAEPVGAARQSPPGPHGYSAQRESHIRRLRRIEGQIRGLQRMVEQDVYCIDILTQVSASTKALQSFALSLLEEHLRHCVAEAVSHGGPEGDDKVAEATAAIARLLRS